VFDQGGATVKDNELEESTGLAPRNVGEKRHADRPVSCGSPASSKFKLWKPTRLGLLKSYHLVRSLLVVNEYIKKSKS